ncbi:MAG: hypothetical protein AAGA21_14540 [Pseudomonadota bacterium]
MEPNQTEEFRRNQYLRRLDLVEYGIYFICVILVTIASIETKYLDNIILYILSLLVGVLFIGRLRDKHLINEDINEIKIDANHIKSKIDKVREINISYILDNHIRIHGDKWQAWRSSIEEDLIVKKKYAQENSDSQIYGWIDCKLSSSYDIYEEFLAEFFHINDIRVEQNSIFTTSDFFVDQFEKATLLLGEYLRENIKDKKLFRYHISGMLPEDFYNGPQIEYHRGKSNPIIFCHKWENMRYNAMYSKATSISNICTVSRCLLVRQSDWIGPNAEDLCILPTEADLQFQKQLLYEGDDHVQIERIIQSRDFMGSAERLLKYAQDDTIAKRVAGGEDKRNVYAEYMKEIVGHNRFHFLPIYHNEYKSQDSSFFLDKYISDNHSDETKAFYFCFNDQNSSNVSRIFRENRYFDKGIAPEIVLFGVADVNDEQFPSEWIFGLKGKYKHFTRDIEIAFVDREQCEGIVNDFEEVVANHRQLSKL